MKASFSNGRIAIGSDVLNAASFALSQGKVTAIDTDDRPSGAIDLEGGWLLPGFIDTQVNGGGGVLFNDDVSVEAIAAIGAAHARGHSRLNARGN